MEACLETLECPVCKRRYYEQYLKGHPCKGEKLPHTCQTCRKSFSTLDNLAAHKTIFHSNSCFICKKKFERKCDVDKHIPEAHLITTDDGKKKYPCPYTSKCKELFNERYYLKTHIAWSHEGVKPFQCDFCGQCYLEKDQLEAHTTRLHSEKTCHVCKSVFPDMKKFKLHFAIEHDGIKPFICAVCEEKFISRAMWKQHLHDANHKLVVAKTGFV